MKRKLYTLVVPRFEDIFHSYFAQEIIKGASSAASRLNVDLLIHITENLKSGNWPAFAAFQAGFSDGIMFADIDQNELELNKFISKNIPYIVLNNFFEGPINCIGIDNYKATLKVIDYLLSCGHTRIATICGDLNTEAGVLRLKGYKDRLTAYNIPINKKYIKKGDFLRTPARRAAEYLLSLDPPPTAIFAVSDVMALEVIDVAKSNGIKIPEKLSVIGFDDNPLNEYSSISLTTVRQPIAEMARMGLELLNRIRNGQEPSPVKKQMKARLIKRDSCGECK